MPFFEYMFVPTILFLVIVAPLWILMHYRSEQRSSSSLSKQERESLDYLLETIDRVGDRLQALEAILDADHPEWRKGSPAGAEQGGPTKRAE